jgi:hypothetical protein
MSIRKFSDKFTVNMSSEILIHKNLDFTKKYAKFLPKPLAEIGIVIAEVLEFK